MLLGDGLEVVESLEADRVDLLLSDLPSGETRASFDVKIDVARLWGVLRRVLKTDRYPTSVLHFASVGTTAKERVHPQQKPVPLCRYLVETYSAPGDLVVDPCAGSGAVGGAAEACGRRFVGWDVSPRFGVGGEACEASGVF